VKISVTNLLLLCAKFVLLVKIFEGNAAASSFVNFSFGRSGFLCRYERARSHIPMVRFGMRVPSQRALALRSVGMARG